MEREKSKSFLGVGFKFPVQVDTATGRIMTVEYEEDIKEAIEIILMTHKGERVMCPEFGCNIHDYIFEAMNYTTLIQMEKAVEQALSIWEPRIQDIEVKINNKQKEEGKLWIEINYVVRSTNNPFNLVYPYYLNEELKL